MGVVEHVRAPDAALAAGAAAAAADAAFLAGGAAAAAADAALAGGAAAAAADAAVAAGAAAVAVDAAEASALLEGACGVIGCGSRRVYKVSIFRRQALPRQRFRVEDDMI